MGINKGYLTAGRTSSSDECLTPRYGVIPIIKHLQNKGYKKILCPFDKEDSFYVRELSKYFDVDYSHLDDGFDFFDVVTLGLVQDKYDCIVSNPPFSIKDKVLQRLYSVEIPFAILLPQNSLQSIKRVRLFRKYRLEYLGFDKRICFYTNGDMSGWKKGNHFASGYFCRDVLPDNLMFENLIEIQESYNAT